MHQPMQGGNILSLETLSRRPLFLLSDLLTACSGVSLVPFFCDSALLTPFSFVRKGTLLVNNLLALFAAALMGASFPMGLFELLIVGRFLVGMNT
ncbi:hypothetical protein E2320_012368, partial [Naja naja]